MIRITAEHEGACLDRAVLCGERFYSLQLRPDTWYYFNFKIEGCKNKDVIFQFVCSPHVDANYCEGKFRWLYGGYIEKPLVTYDGKHWEEVESIRKIGSMPGQFIFQHTFREDRAIVSFNPTYLYSDLERYLDKLSENPSVTVGTIGKSRSGAVIPSVSITGNTETKNISDYFPRGCRRDDRQRCAGGHA